MPESEAASRDAAIADLSQRIKDALIGGTPAPEPGVYQDIPAADYHAWDAVSNSRLSLLDRSPAHLVAALLNPKPDTPAQRLGSATHCAVLEPEVFAERYVMAQRCEAIKKDKDQCSFMGIEKTPVGWRCGVHGGSAASDVLKAEEWQHCVGVANAFRKNPDAANLLTCPGENELSIVWIDEETGLKVKMRLDRVAYAYNTLADLKSTTDARRRPFGVTIYKYGYHRQGALYVPGARANNIDIGHYTIAAFEKELPYAIGLYRLDAGTMDAGEVEVRRLLRLYAECKQKNQWTTAPSYPVGIEDIAIPTWAFSQIDTGSEYGA